MITLYAGIDIAKNVFALHGVNTAEAVVLRQPKVPRARLHESRRHAARCTIGIEACSGALHWARYASHGHTVNLIAPNLVAPTA